MTKVLSKALINSISLTIVTRPPEDFKDKNSKTVIQITETLNSYGIKVVYISNFHQKFTVIDQKIVWYGNVNFLSFGTAEESIMRLTSSDIAGELTDTVL
jgi:ABC-type ATPase involved in cell division